MAPRVVLDATRRAGKRVGFTCLCTRDGRIRPRRGRHHIRDCGLGEDEDDDVVLVLAQSALPDVMTAAAAANAAITSVKSGEAGRACRHDGLRRGRPRGATERRRNGAEPGPVPGRDRIPGAADPGVVPPESGAGRVAAEPLSLGPGPITPPAAPAAVADPTIRTSSAPTGTSAVLRVAPFRASLRRPSCRQASRPRRPISSWRGPARPVRPALNPFARRCPPAARRLGRSCRPTRRHRPGRPLPRRAARLPLSRRMPAMGRRPRRSRLPTHRRLRRARRLASGKAARVPPASAQSDEERAGKPKRCRATATSPRPRRRNPPFGRSPAYPCLPPSRSACGSPAETAPPRLPDQPARR